MLTRTEAADIPSEVTTQRTIASLGLSIGQYMKTLQGRQMIESQELFILGGKLYQGYSQRAVETTEDQCVESEIEAAHDVDGSKERVLGTRSRRLEGAALAKKRELAGRRKAEIATERDALELAKLQREESAFNSEVAAEAAEEAAIAAIVPPCHCGKQFATARALNAHKMGAKH